MESIEEEVNIDQEPEVSIEDVVEAEDQEVKTQMDL